MILTNSCVKIISSNYLIHKKLARDMLGPFKVKTCFYCFEGLWADVGYMISE